MLWALYASGAALTQATLFALTKYYLKDVPRNLFLALSWLTGACTLFVLTLVLGIPTIKEGFVLAVTITTLLNIVAALFYARAVMIEDLSLAFPMLAFTPAFLLLTSPLIRNEYPSMPGIIGILIVVIGAYLLGLEKNDAVLEPFKRLATNKGVQLMFGVAFLYSITANYDKTAVFTSSVVFAPMIMFFGLGLFFLLLYLLKPVPVKKPSLLLQSGLVGLVPATSIILQNLAFLTAIVPYVSSVKRLSLVFNLLYAKFLFKEAHLARRGLAALVMLVGAAIIVLASGI